MSRWLVNPLQLAKNIRQACRVGVSARDQWNYLCWLYHQKGFRRASPAPRHIRFRLDPPLGEIHLAVRDNRGADQLVFGEVLIKRDYQIDIAAPHTILDLGGNIGLATLYFGRRWPNARIAVVEPIPTNITILRENLALNDITATVFANAVGVTNGVVTMALANLDCSHHIVADGQSAGPRGGLTVEALTIPTMLERLGWDRVSLLKMDIEGYEAELFRSQPDWLLRVDAVCLEAFDGTITPVELMAIAKSYGFEATVLPSRLQFWHRP
jgi:FkbM family methyltransferase